MIYLLRSVCPYVQGDPDTKYSSDYDWWTKYYCSTGDAKGTQDYIDEGHDLLKVYPSELEESFNYFTDFIQSFALHRGKGSRDPEEGRGQPVGHFKGSLKAYPIPDDESKPMPKSIFSNMPSSATFPLDVIVRVYIIKVSGLH